MCAYGYDAFLKYQLYNTVITNVVTRTTTVTVAWEQLWNKRYTKNIFFEKNKDEFVEFIHQNAHEFIEFCSRLLEISF